MFVEIGDGDCIKAYYSKLHRGWSPGKWCVYRRPNRKMLFCSSSDVSYEYRWEWCAVLSDQNSTVRWIIADSFDKLLGFFKRSQ